jgi:hypothetical protein
MMEEERGGVPAPEGDGRRGFQVGHIVLDEKCRPSAPRLHRCHGSVLRMGSWSGLWTFIVALENRFPLGDPPPRAPLLVDICAGGKEVA